MLKMGGKFGCMDACMLGGVLMFVVGSEVLV